MVRVLGVSKWTQAVQAGKKNFTVSSRPTVHPIFQTTAFSFDSLEEIDQAFSGQEGTYIYSRYGNPSVHALESVLAELEGGQGSLVAASGMAAISASLLSLCQAGDHIIAAADLYGGTRGLLERELGRFGISTSFVDMTIPSKVEELIGANTKVILAETISNPLMRLVDFSELATLKRAYKLSLVVDNTFASPMVCRPLEQGADLVVESLTKYINGHSDVMLGAAIGNDENIDRIRAFHTHCGAQASPFEAWLVMRSLQTLPLRMRQHIENAMTLAEFLTEQAKVLRVYYPGLPGHEQFTLAQRQLNGFGGMLSFEVDGGSFGAERVVKSLALVNFVPSLGGVATTVSHPAKTSHRGVSAMERARLGIDDGLIRVSVGLEDVSDICAEFGRVLAF